MDRDAVIEILKRRLKARDDVIAAWLFGSRARGTERKSSDVDVAVLRQPSEDEGALDSLMLDVEDDIRGDLGGLEVQLVVVNEAPSDLVHRVLRDGILLIDRDKSRRVGFTVRKRAEYFDLEPVRRVYRRAGANAEAAS